MRISLKITSQVTLSIIFWVLIGQDTFSASDYIITIDQILSIILILILFSIFWICLISLTLHWPGADRGGVKSFYVEMGQAIFG
jgi:uncharacterized membrane protein